MIVLLILLFVSTALCADEAKSLYHRSSLGEKVSPKPNEKSSKGNQRKRKISFYFDNEDLVDVINLMSAEKKLT